jgi:hypothetical protein
MEEEQEFNPTFENRGFWEYYKDLERQFENFLNYVPYLKDNESTYSFRLANILLGIGAHIFTHSVNSRSSHTKSYFLELVK